MTAATGKKYIGEDEWYDDISVQVQNANQYKGLAIEWTTYRGTSNINTAPHQLSFYIKASDGFCRALLEQVTGTYAYFSSGNAYTESKYIELSSSGTLVCNMGYRPKYDSDSESDEAHWILPVFNIYGWK